MKRRKLPAQFKEKSQSGTRGRATSQAFPHASGSQGLRLCLGALCVPSCRQWNRAQQWRHRAVGTFMEDCHLELALLSLHSWRVVTWNWLYCPFPCHRTFLGASIKKVGPGSLMGGPGFTWMTTGCQSIFPSRKSSASLLSSLAQGCSTWYCWARPFYSSCFHHRP